MTSAPAPAEASDTVAAPFGLPGLVRAAVLAMVAGGLLAGGVAVFGRGETLILQFLHDFLVFGDGIYRITEGLRPHRDFETPLGPLAYDLPVLGAIITGGLGGAIEMASLLLAVLVVPAAALMLWRRSRLAIGLLVLLCIAAMVIVPIDLEATPDMQAPAMFYNRWGWALVLLPALLLIAPRQDADSRGWARIEGLICGIALAMLVAMKISYGLAAAGLLIWALVYGDGRARAGLVALTTGVALLALGTVADVLGLPGLYPQGYWRDLQAAYVASGALRDPWYNILRDNLEAIGFLLVAVTLGCVAARPGWRDIGALALAGLLGGAIVTQNFHDAVVPLWLLGLLWADRQVDAAAQAGMVAVLTLGMMGTQIVHWGIAVEQSVLWPGTERVSEAGIAGLERVQVIEDGDRLDLLGRGSAVVQVNALRDVRPGQQLTQQEYLKTLRDGVTLVRGTGGAEATVLALDFVNPFPALTGGPLKPGDLSWRHLDRTVSDARHAAPADLLRDVDVVMVPRLPVEAYTADWLRNTYLPAVAARCAVAGSSRFWTQYRCTP